MTSTNQYASYQGHLLRDTVREITELGMKISDLPNAQAAPKQNKLTINQDLKESIKAEAEGLSLKDYQQLRDY